MNISSKSQISVDSANAFLDLKGFKKANMEIEKDSNGVYMFLYGNLIAKIADDKISISTAGWDTITTVSRLNALCFELFGENRITRKAGALMYNGQYWDGKQLIIRTL